MANSNTPLELKEREAAQLLRLSPEGLARRRQRGTGPPYRVYHRTIRYSAADLQAYMEQAAAAGAKQREARA